MYPQFANQTGQYLIKCFRSMTMLYGIINNYRCVHVIENYYANLSTKTFVVYSQNIMKTCNKLATCSTWVIVLTCIAKPCFTCFPPPPPTEEEIYYQHSSDLFDILIATNANVLSRTGDIHLGPSLHLHPSVVYVSSECPIVSPYRLL